MARNVLECAAKCQILDQDTGCNAFKYYNETRSCEMAQVEKENKIMYTEVLPLLPSADLPGGP